MQMKVFKCISIVLLTILVSCSSVRVNSDYDTKTNFSQYKTFAFYKEGVDKADISDLDKKRILRAIEEDLTNKGFTKSSNPDLMVSIFTKSKEKVDVYNNGPYRGGWYPMYYGAGFGTSVNQYTEGTLFIDFIDTNKKEMIWQGIGSGALNYRVSPEKKEARIKEFVTEILEQYPPGQKK